MSAVVAIALVTILAAPAWAQTPPADDDPNTGKLTVTAGTDLLNTYMFRGIRQNGTEVVFWPYVDLGLAFYQGDGGVKNVTLNLGSWNSLHTGDTGSDGPSKKLWYEGDFYATLGLGLGEGITFATTYTAYTSPNNMFSTVKELAFKVGMDDSPYLGRLSLKPYGLIAFEFDTVPGGGQADGGGSAGRYLEVGLAPGLPGDLVSVTFPLKLGLSLADYYELNVGTASVPIYKDSNFGFLSAGAIVTVPLGGNTSYGAWNLHGGLEFYALGDTTEQINRLYTSDSSASKVVVGSIGFGVSY